MIHLGDNQVSVALGVCRVTVRIGSCTTRWAVRVMELLAEYDLVLGDDWLRSNKTILNWENDLVSVRKGGQVYTFRPTTDSDVPRH